MRTYMMKDKVDDMHNVIRDLNNELSRYFPDFKGPFILMPHLSVDSLEILGELPGIIKVIKKDEFAKNTDWEKIIKPKSSLKEIGKLVKNYYGNKKV